MTDPRLLDFSYRGDDEPAGVIERGMGDEAVVVINEVAAAISEGLDASPGQRRDCRYACAAWERALRTRGLDVHLLGGEGVDDDVFSGYRLVPVDLRSGYREGDNLVLRHYWLGIGPERLIFDPTAHQFDHKGGVSLDRYTLGGESVIAHRARIRDVSA